MLDLNLTYNLMDVIERGIIEYLIVLRKEVKEYEGFEEYPEL